MLASGHSLAIQVKSFYSIFYWILEWVKTFLKNKDSLSGQGWNLLLESKIIISFKPNGKSKASAQTNQIHHTLRKKNNHGIDKSTHPFRKRPPYMKLIIFHLFGTLPCIKKLVINKWRTKWIIVQAATRDHSGDYSCSGLFGSQNQL